MKRIIFILIFLGSLVWAQTCPLKTTADENGIIFVGRITDLGGDDEVYVWFEFGENESNLVRTKEEIRRETGIFCIKVENLKPCTLYFYRAGIRNKTGINYGEIKSIKTKCYDSNSYRSIKIILPADVSLKKCSVGSVPIFVVNQSSLRKKIKLYIEGEGRNWFRPDSLSFILPAKAKRKVNWKVSVPCKLDKNSYQFYLKLQKGKNIFNYPLLIKINSGSSLNLNTR